MYSKIIDNQTIDISNTFSFFIGVAKKYYNLILVYVVLNSILGLFGTPKYSASVSFYTDYNDLAKSNGSLSLFTSFALNNVDQLNFDISNYLISDTFYKKIIYDVYKTPDGKKSLFDIWEIEGNPSFFSDLELIPNVTEDERKFLIAKELLDEAINFSEDSTTGLNTIRVVIKKYPEVAKDLTEKIYLSIVDYFANVTQAKAVEKISFIEGRLIDISSNLKLAEDEMISFLEQNKSLSSPNLSVQKDRLQRNITLYSQLFGNLSDQLELAKIDAKNSINPIFTLDKPVLSIKKAGSSLPVKIILNLFTIFILLSFIEAFRFRKDLFRF